MGDKDVRFDLAFSAFFRAVIADAHTRAMFATSAREREIAKPVGDAAAVCVAAIEAPAFVAIVDAIARDPDATSEGKTVSVVELL